MISPFKIITCDLGPNAFLKDALLSLSLLFDYEMPEEVVKNLESEFSKMYGCEAISFNSGRTSLLALLKLLGIKTGDEVLLQAYTCVAVADSIIWAGGKPVFVDIDEKTCNISPIDLEKKITKKSKFLIIQHTFGVAADIKKLLGIAKKHNLQVIEDSAHATGVKFEGKFLGTFGDAGFFSFGRDKMISSVFGGMVITKDPDLAAKLRNYQQGLSLPNTKWTAEQLLYTPLVYFIIQTYNLFGLGKLVHFFSKKLKILSKAVQEIEKKGQKPSTYPQKISPALSVLALSQLKRLENFQNTRLEFSKLYQSKLIGLPMTLPSGDTPLLRYNILVDDPDKLKNFAQKEGIFLGNWYDSAISPKGVDFEAIGYQVGSCPVAEKVAEKSINLPTNPNLDKSEIEKVIKVIKKYYAQS